MNNNYNNGYPPAPQPQYPAQSGAPTQQYSVNNVPVQPPVPQPYQPPVSQPRPVDPGKNTGVASLILGIVSLVFSWTFLIGIGCGIAGIITAVKSKKATLNARMIPSGLPKGGLICSIIGLVLTVGLAVAKILLFLLPIIAVLQDAFGSSGYYY